MRASFAGDLQVTPGESLQPGTHVFTARRVYQHHGIYVGDGKVIHYGGFACRRHGGEVEEVGVEQFTRGRPLWIRNRHAPCFQADEVVRRARSRLGEDRYRVFTNNCEHFCEWCLRAQHRSYQVEEWRARPRRVLRRLFGGFEEVLACCRADCARVASGFKRSRIERSMG